MQGEIRGRHHDGLRRLPLIDEELKRFLCYSRTYSIIETRAAAAAVDAVGYLHGSKGCDAKFAIELGADQALIGWVQKSATLS